MTIKFKLELSDPDDKARQLFDEVMKRKMKMIMQNKRLIIDTRWRSPYYLGHNSIDYSKVEADSE